MGGSSPLTRGKRYRGWPGARRLRLIPAHAGKTECFLHGMSAPRAHPRSRGENVLGSQVGPVLHGSSPLTRGKLSTVTDSLCARGIIPAHAGKTCLSRPRAGFARAHPRSCGENTQSFLAKIAVMGSSPLTWGKPRGGQLPHRLPGFIPFHAGKTADVRRCIAILEVHPRSRRENTTKKRSAPIKTGSSPLTRGKQPRTILGRRTEQLIPAHAGKTPPPTHASTNRPAHPRSHGENRMSIAVTLSGLDSSLLMRGKRLRRRPDDDRARLIPAHAGKTGTRARSGPCGRAHPRSCGENTS